MCVFPFSMLYIFSKVIHDMQVKGTAINESLVMWWQDMKEGKHSTVLSKGIGFLMGLCLWTLNFTSISQFVCLFLGLFSFLPLQVGNNC